MFGFLALGRNVFPCAVVLNLQNFEVRQNFVECSRVVQVKRSEIELVAWCHCHNGVAFFHNVGAPGIAVAHSFQTLAEEDQ